MTKRMVGGILLAFAIAASLQAQQVQPEPPKADDVPKLTELEVAKAEVLKTKAQMAALLQQYNACKAEVGSVYSTLTPLRSKAATDELAYDAFVFQSFVESNHPGWTFDMKTGQFTKKPEAPKQEKK